MKMGIGYWRFHSPSAVAIATVAGVLVTVGATPASGCTTALLGPLFLSNTL